jgi:hypothetical protein
MCKSTDLIKQDGLFVCQNCGVKYSVDDVKNMMVDKMDKPQPEVTENQTSDTLSANLSNQKGDCMEQNYGKNVVVCPKCGAMVKKETFEVWQYILVICFFTSGLGFLALLAGRKPSVCYKCNTVFKTEMMSTAVGVVIGIEALILIACFVRLVIFLTTGEVK